MGSEMCIRDRCSKVSKVEVILSDKMSREPWSRDLRWMGASGNGTGSTSAAVRWNIEAKEAGTSPHCLTAIFPPFPLRLDRTSRFQICVFRFLSFRCFLGVVLLFSARSISRQRLPAPFFRRLLQDGMFLLSSSRLHSGVVFPQILSSFFERQP